MIYQKGAVAIYAGNVEDLNGKKVVITNVGPFFTVSGKKMYEFAFMDGRVMGDMRFACNEDELSPIYVPRVTQGDQHPHAETPGCVANENRSVTININIG